MTSAPAQQSSHAWSVPARGVAALILGAAALVFLQQTLATSDWPSHAVIWGGLTLAAAAFSLLCVAGTRQDVGLGLARWKLGSWILLWYGIAFGLATLTWSQAQSGASAEIALSSVIRALWLVGVGMAVWTAGYMLGPGRLTRNLAERVVARLGRGFSDQVRNRSAPWILYGIGIAGRLTGTATTGRFGYAGDVSSVFSSATGYQQLLAGLSLCAPLGVAAAAIQVYRERLPGARTTLGVLFAAELVFGAAAGGKQSFVIAVLAVAIPFSAARRRLPRAALIIFPLIFITVVIPFNRAYRGAVRGPSSTLSPSQAVSVAPQIFQNAVTGQNPVTLLPDSADYLLQRIREIDTPALILQRTPQQVPFMSPVQLFEAPLAGIVPRSIWAGKPIMATGYQVSQTYYGFSATTYTSSAVTPVGDLYRHGGWVPVVTGMFLLGCAVRLLDDVLDVRANPHAIFLVLLLFPVLVKSETDWITLLGGIPSTLLVWVIAVALTFRPKGAR